MIKTILAIIGACTIVYHAAVAWDKHIEGKYARRYANADKPA